MELKDFMNSKGLPMDFTITLSSRRHRGTRTIVLSELIEEYHQSKLKTSEVSKNVPFKRKSRYMKPGSLSSPKKYISMEYKL